MTHNIALPQAKIYDLQERSSSFGDRTIAFLKILPDNTITRPLIGQLVRSSTSIGANYMEADGAESKKDFRHKIGICRKEAKESMHWLRMITGACPAYQKECSVLWQEANELALIFSSIFRKSTPP